MKLTRLAAAAAITFGGFAFGSGTASAATPQIVPDAAQSAIVQVDSRPRDNNRHRRHEWRPPHRWHGGWRPYHNYRPPPCRVKWVVRYTYWGPQWVPIRTCRW